MTHAKIYLVDYLKEINLKLHNGKEWSRHFNIELTSILSKMTLYISTKWTPKTKELNIVMLDEAKRTKVIKFFICESECTEVINLCIDFIAHLRSEYYIFVATFEEIDTFKISVLMEHYLVHRKLVEVSIK
jgi:hypothetical protein